MAEPVVSEMDGWSARAGRGLLLVGVGGLVMVAVALFGVLASVHARMVGQLFRVDPETGWVVGPSDHGQSFQRALELQVDLLLPLTGAGLMFAILIVLGLRRRGLRRGRRLVLMVAPILAPLVLGLGAGAFTDVRLDSYLASLYEGLSGEMAHYVSAGCSSRLEACSRARALDLVRTLTIVVGASVSALLLVPAVAAAWRAGKRGEQLGRGWSGLGLALFCAGVIGVGSTRAHRRDLRSTLATCDNSPLRWYHQRYESNPASTELQAIAADGCDARLWPNYWDWTLVVVGVYQLFATGELSELPFALGRESSVDELLSSVDIDSQDLRERLANGIRRQQQIAEMRGEQPPVDFTVVVYADARTPAVVFTKLLETASAAGVTKVYVFGDARVHGELATVGPWIQRVYCPIALLDSAELMLRAEEFETWAELVAGVRRRGH